MSSTVAIRNSMVNPAASEAAVKEWLLASNITLYDYFYKYTSEYVMRVYRFDREQDAVQFTLAWADYLVYE